MASAVANYLGAREVLPEHVVAALDVLEGRRTLDDLGRPVSPLATPRGGAASAAEEVRRFAQEWITRPGNDPTCPLGPERVDLLRTEVQRLSTGD